MACPHLLVYSGQTKLAGNRAPVPGLFPKDQSFVERARSDRDRGCAVTISNKPAPGSGLLTLAVSDAPASWNLPENDTLAVEQAIAELESSGVLIRRELLAGGEGI